MQFWKNLDFFWKTWIVCKNLAQKVLGQEKLWKSLIIRTFECMSQKGENAGRMQHMPSISDTITS